MWRFKVHGLSKLHSKQMVSYQPSSRLILNLHVISQDLNIVHAIACQSVSHSAFAEIVLSTLNHLFLYLYVSADV